MIVVQRPTGIWPCGTRVPGPDPETAVARLPCADEHHWRPLTGDVECASSDADVRGSPGRQTGRVIGL